MEFSSSKSSLGLATSGAETVSTTVHLGASGISGSAASSSFLASTSRGLCSGAGGASAEVIACSVSCTAMESPTATAALVSESPSTSGPPVSIFGRAGTASTGDSTGASEGVSGTSRLMSSFQISTSSMTGSSADTSTGASGSESMKNSSLGLASTATTGASSTLVSTEAATTD